MLKISLFFKPIATITNFLRVVKIAKELAPEMLATSKEKVVEAYNFDRMAADTHSVQIHHALKRQIRHLETGMRNFNHTDYTFRERIDSSAMPFSDFVQELAVKASSNEISLDTARLLASDEIARREAAVDAAASARKQQLEDVYAQEFDRLIDNGMPLTSLHYDPQADTWLSDITPIPDIIEKLSWNSPRKVLTI